MGGAYIAKQKEENNNNVLAILLYCASGLYSLVLLQL